MSYGKWKALHPHTEVEEPKKEPQRRCKICGQEIPNHRRRGILYCSEECSYQAKLAVQRRHDHKKKRMMADGKV